MIDTTKNNIKKTAILLLLLQAFLPCNGQENKIIETAYTQKLEFELKGPVKEVTSYTCKVENGKIPPNSAIHLGKITMTFDNTGNIFTINKLWDFGTLGKSAFLSHYFGKGKALSFKETGRFNDGDLKEINYKYVWSDDYNYSIVATEDSTRVTFITLDKNYRLLKSVYKHKETMLSMEEFETVYKNNMIQEIKTKTTDNTEGKMVVSYQIQVVQKHDTYGNPTFIYGYKNSSKQKVEYVLYKEYIYY